ncbi:hypothetical protein J8L70_12105 [Pseudoalteromonas sp. MMG010]|uniref:hypothetical protein n=1 Tax=Pseudoalteromonas sp. MMG010 TaxID=2822685 RepID=UPI001B39DC21|nr:hypothetical protein [Pseudoalteromonas sp. MMG010]MBQ4833988.1 hypothetical protein [Pseudoalteromonas sp. MMG010]
MQITSNSQLQMQSYSNMQQSSALTEQNASNKTLESDTVSISQDALSAASNDVERNPVILPGTIKPK